MRAPPSTPSPAIAPHDGGVRSSSRAAVVVAIALAVIGIVVAIVFVPWEADVAPWATLQIPAALDFFTEQQRADISAYVDAAWLPGLLSVVAGPVLALVVLASARLRRSLSRVGPRERPVIRDFLAGFALILATRLVALPFDVWLAVVRRDNGLLIEPWGTWLLRWSGTALVIALLGALAVTVALGIVRRWPRRGWIAVVAGAAVAVAAVSLVVPFVNVVDGTRSDPIVRDRVLAIAKDAGVEVGDVVVVDVADRSPALNATVSGWGPTRTVTLYDTLLTTATPEQVDAIVAHELVHVRDNDVVLGTALAMLGAAVVVSIGLALAMSPGVRQRLGVRGRADTPLVALLVAVVLAGTVVALPVSATISRAIEARADRDAVAITGDPAAYADLIALLAVTNRSTLEPPPWRYALFFTHPTPLQRIAATATPPS